MDVLISSKFLSRCVNRMDEKRILANANITSQKKIQNKNSKYMNTYYQ